MDILEFVKSLSVEEFKELEVAIKSIKEEKNKSRLTIKDFIAAHRNDMSVRLRHALEKTTYSDYNYMDELNRQIVYNTHSTGQKTITELECLLRECNIDTKYYMSIKLRKRYGDYK